ncbi:MAG: hypothetical protein H6742_15420 [Alphaproteobacteria bacterium]|nr:hypothetical protein [Alphaproteobacteria bacterium]
MPSHQSSSRSSSAPLSARRSATEATCPASDPSRAAICSRGTLDALRAEFQRYPPDVQEAALAATGLRLDDRAEASDFGELLAAAEREVVSRADTSSEASAGAARYAAGVTEVLLTMDAEIELMLQDADAREERAEQLVERADDDATDVCTDQWGCAAGGMMAVDAREEAGDLRQEASDLRERAARLKLERDALQAKVFGGAART